MRREEGGDHAQRFHPVELIGAQYLGMNHHRTQWRDGAAQVFPLEDGDELIGGGIPVAVCQKLRPLCAYAAHRFFQLGVGVHRIAPVTFLPFIGAGEPCGPGLRGTVKENLVSTDPQTIFLLSPAEPGQERFSPLPASQ